eukprot:5706591-Amphidinium_carterae.1
MFSWKAQEMIGFFAVFVDGPRSMKRLSAAMSSCEAKQNGEVMIQLHSCGCAHCFGMWDCFLRGAHTSLELLHWSSNPYSSEDGDKVGIVMQISEFAFAA